MYILLSRDCLEKRARVTVPNVVTASVRGAAVGALVSAWNSPGLGGGGELWFLPSESLWFCCSHGTCIGPTCEYRRR